MKRAGGVRSLRYLPPNERSALSFRPDALLALSDEAAGGVGRAGRSEASSPSLTLAGKKEIVDEKTEDRTRDY